MKYLKIEFIISGIVTLLGSIGIVYLIYTVFQVKNTNVQIVNFLNAQVKSNQSAPSNNLAK